MYLFSYGGSRALLLLILKDVAPMCPMGYKIPQGDHVSRRGTSRRRLYSIENYLKLNIILVLLLRARIAAIVG